MTWPSTKRIPSFYAGPQEKDPGFGTNLAPIRIGPDFGPKSTSSPREHEAWRHRRLIDTSSAVFYRWKVSRKPGAIQ